MPFDRSLDVHVSSLRKKLIKARGGGWSVDRLPTDREVTRQ